MTHLEKTIMDMQREIVLIKSDIRRLRKIEAKEARVKAKRKHLPKRKHSR